MSRPKHQNRAPSAHRRTRVSPANNQKRPTAANGKVLEKNVGRAITRDASFKTPAPQKATKKTETPPSKIKVTVNVVDKENASSEKKTKKAPENQQIIKELRRLKVEQVPVAGVEVKKVETSNIKQESNLKKELRQSNKFQPKIKIEPQVRIQTPQKVAEKAEDKKAEDKVKAEVKTQTEAKTTVKEPKTTSKPQDVAKPQPVSKSQPTSKPQIKEIQTTSQIKPRFKPQIKTETRPQMTSKLQTGSQTKVLTNQQTKPQASQPVKAQTSQQIRPQVITAGIPNAIPKQNPSKIAEIQPTPKIAAAILKQEAIEKAVRSTNSHISATNKKQAKKRLHKNHIGWQRVTLAFSCALIITFAVAYFVNLGKSDFSLQVAAMRTGIDASYPSYTPRDYSLTDITSENGKITLNFKNYDTNAAYTLIEEKSTWDSTALYNNYIKDSYSNDYSTIREQGLTIYIDGQNAAWVNGGVFYRIKINSGTLTKKQITTIATSL